MNHSARTKLEEITDMLLQELPNMKNAGLLNGKMGISLFFYHLARETESSEHHDMAGKLIDEVYEEVNANRLPPDFANGLAGIAWGIEYLVQNEFVDAETDLILSDVDDKIYQFITTTRDLPLGIESGMMGYMLYLHSRLNGNAQDSEDMSTLIFNRLLIDLINRLGSAIEEKKLMTEEPRLFHISWELPTALILLGRCYAMKIHTFKIERILEYLSSVVLSLYPRLSCHRLSLLFGIQSVLQQCELPGWNEHSALLKQNIQLSDILDHELKNKHLHFKDGFVGMAFICRHYTRCTGETTFLMDNKALLRKCIESELWAWMELHPSDKKNLGLLTGIAGIGVELLELLKEQLAEVNLE